MWKIPRRFAGIKRFEQIVGVLSSHGWDFFLEKSGLKKKSLWTKKYESRPVELRMLFEELGGSFIKFGQFLSLRPDLIPKEFCNELSKLQDSVEGFSYEEVEHIVKHELKKPIKALFKSFEKKPIAAASIGQVHAATLKSGKKVAVKVMRPGIRALFETDLEILDYLSRLVKHHFDPEVFDPEEIFDEFKRYTENELDYLKEARNIKLFRDMFKSDKKLIIPKVYDDLSTKRILVMEYVPGIKLSDIIHEPGRFKKVNKTKLCKDLAESFMKQIFLVGDFHADPHPGNIIVSKTKIALLDFGIIGRLDDEMKEKLGGLLLAVVNRNPDEIVTAMMNLNLVDTAVDRFRLREEIIDQLGEFYDVPLEKMDIAELFFRCIDIARRHKIKISREFVLLGKSLVTLKGVCLELNPKFNIVQESKSFMKTLMADKRNPKHIIKRIAAESERFARFVHDIPDQTRKIFGLVSKADTALDTINHDIFILTREVRKESIRVVLGVIVAALIISSSVTIGIDPTLSKAFALFAGIMLAFMMLSIFFDGFRRNSML
ncbi:AarF/ABC1/UbiB kinase family protein [Candidatus Woesearchaeota archaeon]|nr:AarF/ABC1/UbiB kinase family protein [Candidatus Woesearchaeota archaeon]